jgi:hypothetical protein
LFCFVLFFQFSHVAPKVARGFRVYNKIYPNLATKVESGF